MKLKQLAAVALAFGLPTLALVAQNDAPPQDGPPGGPQQRPPSGMPPQGGPRRGMRRPPPPIIAALDTNRDGVIDADEIANAPAALKTLLKPGSDHLTVAELLGPPPRRGMGPNGGPGGPGQGPDQDGPGDGPGPGQGPGGDQGPGPGAGPDGGMPPGPPPGGMNGPAGGPGNRRLPPIIMALDANHDGIIDASEIANASAALKTLDKTGSGKLSVEQLLGPRPQGGMGMRPGPGPGPDGPPGGGPGGNQPPPDQQ